MYTSKEGKPNRVLRRLKIFQLPTKISQISVKQYSELVYLTATKAKLCMCTKQEGNLRDWFIDGRRCSRRVRCRCRAPIRRYGATLYTPAQL